VITVRFLKEMLEDFNEDKGVCFRFDVGGSREKVYEIEEVSIGYADDEDGDRVEVVMLEAY
jgi:hypothetical protein